jgi:sugar phosphate isomerase/epimerase
MVKCIVSAAAALAFVGGACLAMAPAEAPKEKPKDAPKAKPAAKGDGFEPGKKFADGSPDAEKLGWRLGMQSYTFRGVSFLECLDRMAALGIKYVEAFPGHRLGGDLKGSIGSMDADAQAKVLARCKELNIQIVCVGVIGIPNTEPAAREFFKKWKAMGVETIVTESNLPFLDKICDDLQMNVAFHNHPGSWPPDQVLEATKGRSKRIGACADNGHWLRSKLNLVPLECIKKLEGRIISMHFKDLNAGKADVPWGTGIGDVRKQLELLHAQGFKGVMSIEYESSLTMDALAQCVKFLNDSARDIAAGKSAPKVASAAGAAGAVGCGTCGQ